MTETYVLYHGGCPDGWVAALAPMWGDSPTRIACKYGDPLPKLPSPSPGDRLGIVDFSFGPEQTLKWARDGWRIDMRDHHASALDDFKKYEGLVSSDVSGGSIFFDGLVALDGFRVEFNMDESGATLAWERVNPPTIVRYVRDKDLWKFEMPGSKQVSALINALPLTVEAWEPYLRDDVDARRLIELAGPALMVVDKAVEQLAAQVYEVVVDGTPVAVVPHCPYQFSSDAAERALVESSCLVAGYFMTDRDSLVVSWGLRSRGGEALELAKRMGGGGHPNAAGFRTLLTAINSKTMEVGKDDRPASE